MNQNYLGISHSTDGWRNLAQDEYLLNTLPQDALALFFYVNARAVIIGRNQNPWAECNLSAMQKDQVQLVRRVSGGGAVYHDAGNLNFSFICSAARYDEQAQTDLILRALRHLGIDAQQTGRNDIACDAQKFSGNAFAVRANNRQRHGTLLIDTQLDAMGRYLNVSAAKLRAKGVKSVRARVCNLRRFCPELTVEKMYDALVHAFEQEYGAAQSIDVLLDTPQAQREIQALEARHASWRWRLGEAPKFDYQLNDRFSFGMLQLCLTVIGGNVAQVSAYTDALDVTLPDRLEQALTGLPFDPGALASALDALDQEGMEIAAYLRENGFTD
jgi:lipoate-protein ligase A